MFLHSEMTLLSFKTKNHLIMNNGLSEHFNKTIWNCGSSCGLKYFLFKNILKYFFLFLKNYF